MRTEPLQTFITPEDKAAFTELARGLGMSNSGLVRVLVTKAITRREAMYQQLVEEGVPPDRAKALAGESRR